MKFLTVSSILLCQGLAEKPNVVFVLFDDLGWSDVRFVRREMRSYMTRVLQAGK